MRARGMRLATSVLIAASLAASARADDEAAGARADADEAHYEIAAYVWGVSIALKTDTSEGSISQHVSFSDFLSHTSGGFMAHARGEWGPWSADLDGLWAQLRGGKQSKSVRLGPEGGIQAGAEVKTSLTEWIAQATGGYRLFELGSPFSRSPTDARHVRGELFGGARYWSIDPKVNVQTSVQVGPIVRKLSLRIGDRDEWVDPIIGLRFGIDLSSTVVMLIAGDVGGFNIGDYCSDFTWSQTTALKWAFGDSWSAYAGYKFLDFHRDSGDVDTRLQLRGPFLALSYRF